MVVVVADTNRGCLSLILLVWFLDPVGLGIVTDMQDFIKWDKLACWVLSGLGNGRNFLLRFSWK